MIEWMFALALLGQDVAPRGPLDVEVPNAIADLHNRYVLCQDKHFDAGKVRDLASFKMETEAAITACSADKTKLKLDAESRLAKASNFADPAKRAAAIAEAFDGYDRVRRAMAAGTHR
ncbi:MAG TPA: hypothetical protein VGB70_10550 [Allosphingosinicella sp.]|jgi:hypothetical protein